MIAKGFRYTGNWEKPWGGSYAITKRGIMFNEGARPFNFTINWNRGLFLYVFLLGKRWSYPSRKPKAVS